MWYEKEIQALEDAKKVVDMMNDGFPDDHRAEAERRLSEEEIAAQVAAVEPMIQGLATADAVRQWWAGHQKTLDEAVKPSILKLCTERANALKAAANETNPSNQEEKEAA